MTANVYGFPPRIDESREQGQPPSHLRFTAEHEKQLHILWDWYDRGHTRWKVGLSIAGLILTVAAALHDWNPAEPAAPGQPEKTEACTDTPSEKRGNEAISSPPPAESRSPMTAPLLTSRVASPSPPLRVRTYHVHENDSLCSIAAQTNVTLHALMAENWEMLNTPIRVTRTTTKRRFNPGAPLDRRWNNALQVGDRLIIPDATSPPRHVPDLGPVPTCR